MLGMAIRKWWARLTRESPIDVIVNRAPVRHKSRAAALVLRELRVFLVPPMLGVLTGELLLQVRRRRIVMRERHRPSRVAGGHRFQPSGIAVELRKRRLAVDRERSRLKRLGARDLPSASG